jgi:hypothetical protein
MESPDVELCAAAHRKLVRLPQRLMEFVGEPNNTGLMTLVVLPLSLAAVRRSFSEQDKRINFSVQGVADWPICNMVYEHE